METVATAVLDDCQVDWPVTFCVVPFERFAVPVNCAVNPKSGAVPVTVTEVTVGAVGAGVVGDVEIGVEGADGLDEPQAAADNARATAIPVRRIR